MATAIRNTSLGRPRERSYAPGVGLMAAAVVLAFFAIVLNSDFTESFPYLYMLPWIAALAVVLALPLIYLYFHQRLNFYDPLVFATLTHFFPAYVVGGIMLTGGWSQPSFLTLIQDPEYNLPYTTVLIMLGYSGLAVGYLSPLGRKAGAALDRFLPTRDFDSSALIIPGLFLLILGTLNTVAATVLGIIGYQRVETVETYSGLLFLTTLFWAQGSFILWYLIFRLGKLDVRTISLTVLLLATTFGKALFAGNRGSLSQAVMAIILAYVLSGRALNFRRTVIAGVILSVAVIAGMVYGTTFRNVKGTEARVSIDQYTDSIFETVDQLGKIDLKSNMEFALVNLAERLDVLSSVAVVVSNYEQLQPYEESYGLDNNIWKDTSTFFIPRIFWSDKPVASEPRKYSVLYFSFEDNSFVITPTGDLVRNFGPVGVFLGMFLLGVIVRFIFRSLIENQPRTMWRATMYYMLLVSISYEGFYSHLIPYFFKVGFIAVIGLVIVGLIARAFGNQRKLQPA